MWYRVTQQQSVRRALNWHVIQHHGSYRCQIVRHQSGVASSHKDLGLLPSKNHQHSIIQQRPFSSVNRHSTGASSSSSSSSPSPPSPAASPTSSSSSSSSTTSTQPSQPTTEMAPIPPLFVLPIPAYKSTSHTAPEGTITLTQPVPKIYLLTFNSPPDNRLTPPFLATFRLALDILLTLPPGIVVTTSSIAKFYSNGLDYAGAVGDPSFMTGQLYPLWRKLLTFPWPTVALMNGHAFAGGLMTAMAHDYRIMNPHKGFLCLNELDFNAPLTPAMSTMFKSKLSMTTFRSMILEGKRFGALAALEAGIVDGLGGFEDLVKIIQELGLAGKLRDVGVGSYGLIKEEMYREVIADLDMGMDGEMVWEKRKAERRESLMVEGQQRVEAWKSGGGRLASIKPKL